MGLDLVRIRDTDWKGLNVVRIYFGLKMLLVTFKKD